MHIPMEEQVEQGVSPMLSVCGVTTPNVAHGRAALCQMLAAMGSPSMQHGLVSQQALAVMRLIPQ